MTLTPAQIDQLLKPVNATRVRQRDGNSYMEAHDIKAHLTRVFGFGNYDSEVFQLDLMYERPGKSRSGADAVSVGYRAGVRLTIRTPDGASLATFTEYAAAGATNYPVNKLADAHDMAMKSAASYALKRCAIHLGDQFGLSLYNNGSTGTFVGGTLVGAEKPAAPDDVAVTDEKEPTPNPVTPEEPAVTTPADVARQELRAVLERANIAPSWAGEQFQARTGTDLNTTTDAAAIRELTGTIQKKIEEKNHAAA
ncbi:Rad52/Rad22 family DNA repair protein [Brachybacterium massiliense]|uniref:Rad52/Rad22 family DNA repair protein n=1 Tax=Brachybacterium massiliense TaxID=1755098 RepID=UPI000B3BC905|nr:Rad52/Rad22 family DNA repair protein [Brachybacterium massiliense]